MGSDVTNSIIEDNLGCLRNIKAEISAGCLSSWMLGWRKSTDFSLAGQWVLTDCSHSYVYHYIQWAVSMLLDWTTDCKKKRAMLMSLVGLWRANVKPKVGGTDRRHLSSEVEHAWVKLRAEWSLAIETYRFVFTEVSHSLTVGLYAQNSQDTSLYISCKLTSEQWQAPMVLRICVQFSLRLFLSVIFPRPFFFPYICTFIR